MNIIANLELIEKHLAIQISPLEAQNPSLYCAVIYLVMEIIKLNLDRETLTEDEILTYTPAFTVDITNPNSPVVYCNTLQYLQDKWGLCSDGESHLIEVSIMTAEGTALFPFKKEMVYIEGDLLPYISQRIEELGGKVGLDFFKGQLKETDPEIEELKQQIKDICNGE